MTTNARLALTAARPYVSAAANAGGGANALKVLKLIDQAVAELKPPEPNVPRATTEEPWTPPGGWPPEDAA